MKIFPNVSSNYRCRPRPRRFNITASGHLVSNGLYLNDSRLYQCNHRDINGTLSIDLTVKGYVPRTPTFIKFVFSPNVPESLEIAWTNVTTKIQPVTSYILSWNITKKSDDTSDDDKDGDDIKDRQLRITNRNNTGTLSTDKTYHYFPYKRQEIYSFSVYAVNEAGRGLSAKGAPFDVDYEFSILPSNMLTIGWIIFIIIICLLFCCCCCLICLLLLCCLCKRNKKRTYFAEKRGNYF